MKKDYSKNTLINVFGISLPNMIGWIVSILITIPISIIIYFLSNKTGGAGGLIFAFVSSFIGLEVGGRLLNNYCTNNDIDKCKRCKNWNCRRDIK